MQLKGASALVTGAGRGIGRAMCVALAKEGVRVAAVARTTSDLTALVQEIQGLGGEAVAVPGDVAEPGFADQAVAAAVSAHGRLQILINNAGVGHFAPLLETTDADWDRVLATNVTAPFRFTRAALPHLSAGGGQIYMISSLAGQNAISGMSAYCASKAALDHLTACLMLEVRHQGVKVVTLAPGSVDTGFAGGMPRGSTDWMLTPEDLAANVLDLLRGRDDAHISRVELRPLRPQKR